jgi:DsbC/DsbD-like thiol-disulfide interchange protein
MLRVFFISSLVAIWGLSSFAQSDQKVKWQFDAIQKGNNTFELRLVAKIDKGWHLYSRQQTKEAIALPTTIQFSRNPLVELKGEIREEGALVDQVDPATRSRARYYSGQVAFVQKAIRKKKVNTTLQGEIEFMVCDDRQCLPPSVVKFQVRLQ